MRIQKIEVMVATPDDGEPLDIGFCNRICGFKLERLLRLWEIK